MKRILSLTVLFCAVAVSALAAAPEAALKALSLGNEKFVLEQSLAPAPLAIVIADPAISVPATELFGLSESRLAVVKPEGGFGPTTGIAVQAVDLTAPLVVVLGLTEDAVWTVYANTLVASPDLIHAVLKGQISAVGATVDAQSGAVKVLGAHPELQILVGQYLLSQPSGTETEGAAEPASEVAPETEAATEPQAAVTEEKAATETHEAVVQEDAAQTENHAAPAEAAHAAPAEDAQAGQESGGSGFMLVLVFIAALIGVIVFMDKTVLKA
ncbi:hypothetical protein SAMN05421830_11743 [Desulfomicrobium norvegicum]|uniref:Uncharacterized protein n=1 Tax=Desulfomicrobium norvegicum (strain DSM 1741 / NCIMB 8310) TaxID=52561 RepID=A0A8G2C5U3_DESNO|nr:hypothetical protein [Desulfomicrobium norvegicum]SFM16114.1 hypothetical protein SAMN05421830_11743 [Desulfomicrobium norvegicum]